jgi:competence protein ComEA
VWFWPSTVPVEETPAPIVAAGVAPQGVTLHVSGAVASPGLVHVPVGSRVADAIAAAGGVLPGADVGSLNLAAPVRDGEQVRVADGAELGTAGGGGGDPPDDGRIHVNEADAATLELLPGVGPVLAVRILAHRQEHGPFTAVEDLLDVPGIGEGRLAAMRDVVAIP